MHLVRGLGKLVRDLSPLEVPDHHLASTAPRGSEDGTGGGSDLLLKTPCINGSLWCQVSTVRQKSQTKWQQRKERSSFGDFRRLRKSRSANKGRGCVGGGVRSARTDLSVEHEARTLGSCVEKPTQVTKSVCPPVSFFFTTLVAGVRCDAREIKGAIRGTDVAGWVAEPTLVPSCGQPLCHHVTNPCAIM